MPKLEHGFDRDMRFSDRYIPAVKRWFAEKMIVQATPHQDRREASDLIILDLPEGRRMAVRIRRAQYLTKYAAEVTFRQSRPSGIATEFEKILSGWCDWLFYGFADPSCDHLCAFRIINLHKFRSAYKEGAIGRGFTQINQDGSSSFIAFNTAGWSTGRDGIVFDKWRMVGLRFRRDELGRPIGVTMPKGYQAETEHQLSLLGAA